MPIQTIVRLTALSFALALPSLAQAQSTLRWHPPSGEKLTVTTEQKTSSQVTYAGKTTSTQIDLALQLEWEITTANADKLQIKQTLQQLKIAIASPTAGILEYDSASTAKPTGRARDLAATVAPLLGAVVEITMTSRGEILAVKPTNEIANQLFAAGQNPMPESPTAKTTIEQLLKQPLAVLPEKPVNPGDEWSTATDPQTPLGKAKQTTTYRYVGPVEQDGLKLDRIESKTTLQLNPSTSGSKLTLKEHEQTGQIDFSAAAGRVVRAEQKQKLVTERPYRETTIVVSLSSDQTTTISPAAKQ